MPRKFKYIITNTFDGALQGTDDVTKAYELAACEDYFVYDCEAGTWLMGGDEGDIVSEEISEYP